WGRSSFFSSRGRHTSSYGDWSSDVCSSDLALPPARAEVLVVEVGGPAQGQRLAAGEREVGPVLSEDALERPQPHRQLELEAAGLDRKSVVQGTRVRGRDRARRECESTATAL